MTDNNGQNFALAVDMRYNTDEWHGMGHNIFFKAVIMVLLISRWVS